MDSVDRCVTFATCWNGHRNSRLARKRKSELELLALDEDIDFDQAWPHLDHRTRLLCSFFDHMSEELLRERVPRKQSTFLKH